MVAVISAGHWEPVVEGTTFGGVASYDGKSFTNYGREQNLPLHRFDSVLRAKDGIHWFATLGSGGALGESCPFDAMVRGNTSLAYYFGDLSYNLSGSDIACGVGMPGPKARSPHSVGDGLYFRGGYTVRHHSSLKADAVQVELPRCARSPAYFYDASDEEHNAVRQRLADQHARALYQWSVSHQASAWLVDDAWRDEVPPARRKETSSGIGWGLGATVAAAVTIGALRLFLLHSMCLMKRREHYASRTDRSSRPEAELSARPSSSL